MRETIQMTEFILRNHGIQKEKAVKHCPTLKERALEAPEISFRGEEKWRHSRMKENLDNFSTSRSTLKKRLNETLYTEKMKVGNLGYQ